ncbi:hypothetical protein ACQE3E_16470 [Methylomonas sp. MED-D]|uniref:hypothetical protein n=1 Tax=unclassified Methylomonas TaxID=2608980 RepID=UPI0028A45D45|nr:hypothetical protein [Methylomonas sp. MV1]MDT4331047.1 hypothetical protein [Methylomonas sp. MV1]
MKKQHNVLRRSIMVTLGVAGMAAYSNQAAAISPATLPVLTAGAVATVESASGNPAASSVAATNTAPNRAWSDYGTNLNYGWTHTAGFQIFQVGNEADIAAGTRFNVTVDLQAKSGVVTYKKTGGVVTGPTSVAPMNYPAFSIWTSGSDPLVTGKANNGYGHSWNQVRGGYGDGGTADDPCGQGGDCALGSNGWLGTGSVGNILDGHDGWIGYANAGYSFTNGDGDKIQGLYAGASNPQNLGEYGGGASDPLNGTALYNYNQNSPYVGSGEAVLSLGEAILNLTGLKAGYYLIGYAGACPDNNANGQGCEFGAGNAYKLTISNNGVTTVPVPGAVWLFGSAVAGFLGIRRGKSRVA